MDRAVLVPNDAVCPRCRTTQCAPGVLAAATQDHRDCRADSSWLPGWPLRACTQEHPGIGRVFHPLRASHWPRVAHSGRSEAEPLIGASSCGVRVIDLEQETRPPQRHRALSECPPQYR